MNAMPLFEKISENLVNVDRDAVDVRVDPVRKVAVLFVGLPRPMQRIEIDASDESVIEIRVSIGNNVEEFLLVVKEASGRSLEHVLEFVRRLFTMPVDALANGRRIRDILDYRDLAGIY